MNNQHIKAYKKLKENSDWKLHIQLFHNDISNEPHLFTSASAEKINLDSSEIHGFIINILTKESSFSFTEKNWKAHIGEDYVSFSSKRNNGTHYIIEFC